MRRILVLGLLIPCLSFPALANAVFKTDQVEIHFYRTACPLVAIGNFLRQVGEPKEALVIFQGQRIRACFAVDEDGDYLLVDERGSGGFIPGKEVNPGV